MSNELLFRTNYGGRHCELGRASGHPEASLQAMIEGYMEIGCSNSHGTRPFYYNHLDDPVDSDQQILNKDLSLWEGEWAPRGELA